MTLVAGHKNYHKYGCFHMSFETHRRSGAVEHKDDFLFRFPQNRCYIQTFFLEAYKKRVQAYHML